MSCRVCREAFAGIWDPERTPRIDDGWPELEGIRCREWDKERGNCKSGEEPWVRTEVFNYRFGHHRDHASLARSRKEGCMVCLMLDETPKRYGTKVECRNFVTSFMLIPRIIILFAGDVGVQNVTAYSLHRLEDFTELHSQAERSTDSPTTWACVKGWLQGCLSSHELCRQPEGFVPSRLLKLDSSGPERRFSLVSKANLGPQLRYVALSYCWGPQPPETKLRLLQANAGTLETGNPVSTLPKTYRDAFRIVEELGIEFLWIDRLCIVQDSADDWLRESSRMQDVYSSAYVTVCAHGAADDSEGCFFSRDPSRIPPTQLDLGSPYILGEDVMTWDGRFRSRVGSRGWVLQEQLLSHRTIYYGRTQVIWECRTTTCCETFSKRVPVATAVVTDKRALWKTLLSDALSPHGMLPPHLKPDALGYCLHEWEVTVATYAKRCLTYPSDKLVAIAGLAHQMQDRLRSLGADDTYHAGLWAFSFPRGLLWEITTSMRRRPAQHRAPSWSWAGSEGFVHFHGHRLRPDAEVLAADIRACTKSSHAPGAGLRFDGTLTMRGRLALPVWDRTPNVYLGGKTMPLRLLRNADTGAEMAAAEGYIAFDDVFADWSSTGLFCVPLVYDSVRSWRFGIPLVPKWARLGLVLRKEQRDQAGFIRVGFFACVVSDDGQARTFLEGLREQVIEIS